MKRSSLHIELLTMGISMWTLFFMAGLPTDYFLELSWQSQLILIVILPTIVLTAITSRRISELTYKAAMHRIFWTAFYFTAPFIVLDIFYLGMHQKRGAFFLYSHWYLTAFYVTPWVVLPMLLMPPMRRAKSP